MFDGSCDGAVLRAVQTLRPVTTQLSKWSLTSGQSAKALSCSLTEQTESIIVYILHCEKDHVY